MVSLVHRLMEYGDISREDGKFNAVGPRLAVGELDVPLHIPQVSNEGEPDPMDERRADPCQPNSESGGAMTGEIRTFESTIEEE